MKLNNLIAALALFGGASASFAQAADPAPLPVAVDKVIEAPLDTHIQVHGTVFGKRDVDLTAGSDGFLTYVIEPGSEVAKGEVVARIDLLPLELKKAEQQALIKRARINLKHYRQELNRLLELAKSDSAAQTQIDQLQTQVDLAGSDIDIAELKLRQLADQIERATVKAPFAGVISQRMRYAGSDITKATPLVTLLDTANLEVRLYVPVKYLSYVHLGQEMNISSGDLNDLQAGSATISAVIPATDARSQTFEIRAELNREEGKRWATGQLVEVDLPVHAAKPVLQVNRDALILRSTGTYVVKIDDSDSAVRVPVSVGKGDGKLVVVTPKDKQLSAGDRVAVRGAERLQDGQKVRVN